MLARKHHLSEGFLVAHREPGASPYPDDAKTRHVATIDYRAPLIARHVERSQEHFEVVPDAARRVCPVRPMSPATGRAPRRIATMATTFWPTTEHWSCEIPLDTPHPRLDVLRERGFVQLRDLPFDVPEHEYLDLEYMDWKSGGDTNFAPIATADGQLDCRGFWNKGDERPDKGARFTSNADEVPDARRSTSRASAPTSDASARSSSSRRTTTPRSAASTATTTTASTPRPRVGSCAGGSSSPTSPRATCC